MAGWDLPAAPTLAPGAGNLTAHLRKLEDAGYLVVTREFQGPQAAHLVAGAGRPAGFRRVRREHKEGAEPAGGWGSRGLRCAVP